MNLPIINFQAPLPFYLCHVILFHTVQAQHLFDSFLTHLNVEFIARIVGLAVPIPVITTQT